MTESVVDEGPKKLRWCSAGPDGKGWFWGSHGCTEGEHEGHIHRCSVMQPDENGERVIVACCEADDQTKMVRYISLADGTPGEWMPGGGWWQ